MAAKVYNVLFVCTGNSARSIIAEALMNDAARGRFKAYSAGSHPTGAVNPFALGALAELRIPTDGFRSKSWDEFAGPAAPPLDFVFTVCDRAAGETCPFWPGQPMTAHWGLPDPAAFEGSDEEKRIHFRDTAVTLKRRIDLMLSLPDPEPRLDGAPAGDQGHRPTLIVAITARQKLLAEALGTALLLAVVIGSGIMAERLSGGNVAIALLANTLATVGGLYILIEVFGPISGAHFNPAVSLVMAWRRELPGNLLASYIVAQLLGAMLGAWLAHAMFDADHPAVLRQGEERHRSMDRRGVATFGLVLVILRAPAARVAAMVAVLHRRGVLVHGIDLVRQPGGGFRSDVQRQLRRHRALERPRLRRRRAAWRRGGGARASRISRGAGSAPGGSRQRRTLPVRNPACLTSRPATTRIAARRAVPSA